MRIIVDYERCVGSGVCVATEPRVFDQSDDDGTVQILASPAPDTTDAVDKAITLCPSRALRLLE